VGLTKKKMKYHINIGVLILSMIYSTECVGSEFQDTIITQEIDRNWEFRASSTDSIWLSASVPGCVHTDLMSHDKIQDPFYRLNEKDVQWVGETDWEYRTSFSVNTQLLEKENLEMNFEGLDTYANVFLNDSLILNANNMFRTWKVDVKNLLYLGNNTLKIVFQNVFDKNIEKYNNAPYRLQAGHNNDQADVQLSLYSRKAGFHYGWDWGPRLITSGIWRPVTLVAWSDFRIENVYFKQKNVTEDIADIEVDVEINATKNKNVTLTVFNSETIFSRIEVKLKKGKAKYTVSFNIENPELWWTNGLGEQHLYDFTTSVSDNSGKTTSIDEKIGIRSLRVVREKDKFGKGFWVELNGVPVFMKGANYIPQDNFQNRVDDSDYKHIIKSAVDANMNMLRVWGGGIYEEDVFYDLCDKYGLLVWQDIMFACGMFPADSAFMENVTNEVIDNVTRIRNHASIALYCGNNENEIFWDSWGWKEKYSEGVQKQYENDLKTLFYDVIPEALQIADPERYYHPSSPSTGFNNIDKGMGDNHYWGVWHGTDPFSEFENNVSRFVSEYGFQSYPEFESIKKFTIEEDWFLKSDVMHAHQRCMDDNRTNPDYGNRLINTYLERNFKTPKDFENYIYVVQALQAKAVKTAIEAHRRNRTDNYCMGTMYWQINDCWPVASWSSIDYYGKWKALHYLVKKAYNDILITHKENKGNLDFYIVSDQLDQLDEVDFIVETIDFDGEIIRSSQKSIIVETNTSVKVYSKAIEELLKDKQRSNVFIRTRMVVSGKTLSENLYFFENDKLLDLPEAEVQITVNDDNSIELNSDKLAKYVFVSVEGEDVFFSDNYFDLIPGESKTLTMDTKVDIQTIKNKIKVISLFNSYQD
jgi:beta-mannosidase